MDIPIEPNCRVELFEGIDIDGQEGSASSIMFSDYVETWNRSTNKLEFAESDIGFAEFRELVDEADGIEIVWDYEQS